MMENSEFSMENVLSCGDELKEMVEHVTKIIFPVEMD